MLPPSISHTESSPKRSNSENLTDKQSPARSTGTRPDVNNQEQDESTRRRFGDVVKSFFKSLWRHKALLGTGIVSIGVGLATIFVDIVGMGFPAPFLAPLTFGSFALGGGYIVLVILIAFYEAIDNVVTLHTSDEKKQFVLDMVNRKKFEYSEIEKLYDLIIDRYPPSAAPLDLELP